MFDLISLTSLEQEVLDHIISLQQKENIYTGEDTPDSAWTVWEVFYMYHYGEVGSLLAEEDEDNLPMTAHGYVQTAQINGVVGRLRKKGLVEAFQNSVESDRSWRWWTLSATGRELAGLPPLAV